MELTDRKITSLNVEETQRIAAALAEVVVPGTVIALEGDLGAGKTHFTQGLARGLGVGEAVTSPTFNVMSVYDQGRLPLYHFDLYRLEDALEARVMGSDAWNAAQIIDDLPRSDRTWWAAFLTSDAAKRTVEHGSDTLIGCGRMDR